jgi:hypothetical protein
MIYTYMKICFLHNIMKMHLKNIYMHTIQVQKQICKYIQHQMLSLKLWRVNVNDLQLRAQYLYVRKWPHQFFYMCLHTKGPYWSLNSFNLVHFTLFQNIQGGT